MIGLLRRWRDRRARARRDNDKIARAFHRAMTLAPTAGAITQGLADWLDTRAPDGCQVRHNDLNTISIQDDRQTRALLIINPDAVTIDAPGSAVADLDPADPGVFDQIEQHLARAGITLIPREDA